MTQPLHDPERESEGQFLIAVMAMCFGTLCLIGAAILGFASKQNFEESFSPARIAGAIGAGLLALGLSLEFHRIMAFFRLPKGFQATNALMMSALAFILLVLVNVASYRFDFWRADLTSEGLYTLSDESRQLVAGLDKDVRLVLLTATESQHRDLAPIEAILEQYDAASSRVETDRVDLRRLTFEQRTKLYGELKLERLEGREGDLLGVVVQVGHTTADGWVSANSKHIPLQDMWQQSSFLGEQKISSAIREVLEDARPKLYFLEGHAEQSIEDFGKEEGLGKLAGLLRQRNMDAAKLNLLETRQVPDDASLLVIPGPRARLDDREAQAVEAWLQKGGDALIMLEPVLDRRGDQTVFGESGLEEALRVEYGLEPLQRMIFIRYQTELGEERPLPQLTCDDFDLAHPIVKPLQGGRAHFIEALPLKTAPAQGATTTELARSGSLTPLAFALADPLKRRQTQEDLLPGPFTLACSSERTVGEGDAKKKSRVVLVGDATWVTNPVIELRQWQNLELFMSAVSWAMEREEKIVFKVARPKSYRLEMAQETLTSLLLFSLLGLPAISIMVGLFAWSVRRR